MQLCNSQTGLTCDRIKSLFYLLSIFISFLLLLLLLLLSLFLLLANTGLLHLVKATEGMRFHD